MRPHAHPSVRWQMDQKIALFASTGTEVGHKSANLSRPVTPNFFFFAASGTKVVLELNRLSPYIALGFRDFELECSVLGNLKS
jgi:hypothetical protein